MDLPLPVRCVRWWSERLLELALVLACVAEGSTNLGAISTSFGVLQPRKFITFKSSAVCH